MDLIAGWIDEVCRHIDDLDETAGRIRAEIADLWRNFPSRAFEVIGRGTHPSAWVLSRPFMARPLRPTLFAARQSVRRSGEVAPLIGL